MSALGELSPWRLTAATCSRLAVRIHHEDCSPVRVGLLPDLRITEKTPVVANLIMVIDDEAVEKAMTKGLQEKPKAEAKKLFSLPKVDVAKILHIAHIRGGTASGPQ